MRKTLIVLAFVSALIFMMGNVMAVTHDAVNNNEDYEDDTVDANPSGSWYTYGESGIQWANVTDLSGSPVPASSSDQSFLMNTTSDTTGGVLYDVTDSNYSYMQLDVKIDNTSHNYSMITIGTWVDHEFYTGNGAFAWWEIDNTGDDARIIFSTITVLDGNVTTEIYNHTIDNDTWYRLKAEFNYDNYSVHGYLYKESDMSLLNSSSVESSVPFTNITQSFWAIPELHGADSCYIYHDDFILYKNSYGSNTPSEDVDALTGQNFGGIARLVLNIIIIIVAIALLYYVGNEFMNGKKGIDDLVELFKVLFIGLVFLGVIALLINIF